MHATQFASPARLSGEEIAAQIAVLDAGGRVRRLIDAVPGLVALLNAERQVLLANTTWVELAQQLGKVSFAGMKPGEFFPASGRSPRNPAAAPRRLAVRAGPPGPSSAPRPARAP